LTTCEHLATGLTFLLAFGIGYVGVS